MVASAECSDSRAGLGSPRAKALQPRIQGFGVFTAAGWGGTDVPEHGALAGLTGR